MFHLMLPTFVGARAANVGAGAADCLGLVTTASHKGGSHSAYLGAVNIESNAACHRLHIIFFKTRGRAKITGVRARIARIDAALKIHLVHVVLRFEKFPYNGSAVVEKCALGLQGGSLFVPPVPRHW